MTPHVFRGRTLAHAQKAARAALGYDTELLTTRSVPSVGVWGILGKKDVEIAVVANDERPKEVERQARLPFNEAVYRTHQGPSEYSRLRAELKSDLRAVQEMATRTSSIPPAIEAELAALRATVEDLSRPETPRGFVEKRLRALGIEGRTAAGITRTLKATKLTGGALERALEQALEAILECAPWPLDDTLPSAIALIGPSGVGKTTTAAKLAACAISEHGRSVTLVACDSFRVGAVEQLQRFANLLDARFDVATNAAQLAEIAARATSDLLIIDTAGRAPTRADAIEASLGPSRGGKYKGRARHVLLCLPASLREADAVGFARAFAPCNANELVITKLDETKVPAGLIHGPAASGLPIAALCFGQRVPEDISSADRNEIMTMLSPSSQQKRAS